MIYVLTSNSVQVTCETSLDGLCEATLLVPTEWFLHTQNSASFMVQTRLLDSFDQPEVIGNVEVNSRPVMEFSNDVAFVLPSRPVFHSQLFSVPVYGHASYSISAYGVKCQVGENLAVDSLNIDSSRWIVEVRPIDLLTSKEVGIVALLNNSEAALESVITEPELLFSLNVRVLQSAQSGGTEPINCTTNYLSNILNEKIQPRGLVTPAPTLSIGSEISPGRGEVRIAQSVPRGLFSFPEQSQVVNTAVLNEAQVQVQLTHLVAMSSGVLNRTREVQCNTDTLAFSLSPQCNFIILNGTEMSGTASDVIYTSYLSFTSSTTIRIWYPNMPISFDIGSLILRPIQGWLDPDETGSCSQRYQDSSLDAFAEFTYSDVNSPVFRISLLPLISSSLNSSRSDVVVIGDDGSVLVALSPGTSIISAGSYAITPAEVTVVNDPVNALSLNVILFSGFRVNLPVSPYLLLSTQTASVSIEQIFDSISSLVFISSSLLLEDGSTILLDQNADSLTISSLNPSVANVTNGEISLLQSGSGDIIQVILATSCTGLPIAVGNGSADVTVPSPIRLDVEQSSLQITYPDNTAMVGGVPSSLSLTLILVFPDNLTRDVSSSSLITYTILVGAELVTLTRDGLSILITPSDPNRVAFGEVLIAFEYGNLSSNITLSVVTYQEVRLLAVPHPAYPGSNTIIKSTFFQIENTGEYQQASLQLEAILSDNSSVVVTQSPLSFYRAASSSITITGNIVHFSQDGTFSIQGQLGPNVSSIDLLVSSTPVSITALQNFFLPGVNNTLSGQSGARITLNLDVVFSDLTQYPSFIPNATSLFPQTISLTVDTPSAVSINPLTGFLTLQNNHHSLVTVTATSNGLQSQVSFACNLRPSIGDVDLGFSEGIPIPQLFSGTTFSVPLLVNAGQQMLGVAGLTIAYSFELLSVVSVTQNITWIGNFQYVNNPGFLIITASSTSGLPGLVQLGVIEFMAVSAGTGSIGGVVTRLTDTLGNDIGNGMLRQFIAGQVRVDIQPIRSRRESRSVHHHARTRRNTQCLSTGPCESCPQNRETGDVNGDCIFDSSDVQFLLQYHAESLFDFLLESGMDVQASLISAQQLELDSDLNRALDLQDAYFLHQIEGGLLNFLKEISIQPVQESDTCQVSINVTLTARGDISPDPALTSLYIDMALPFDPSFTSQMQFDESVIVVGSFVTSKGLALPGGILKAAQLEVGVFGVVMETNLTVSEIGITAIQTTSPDTLNTNQARTKAMFGSPDPPFTYSNSLSVSIPAFSSSAIVSASQGYNPFTFLNNSMTTLACITPPPPPLVAEPLVEATVAENASVGSEVLRIFAESQSDRSVAYSISSGNTGSSFTIGASDGAVRVALILDYETTIDYVLQILATDPATGFSSPATATITVTDINDNAPDFLMVEQDISLPANTPIGSLITEIEAEDRDGPGLNSMILFSIEEGNVFAIGPITGLVTLQQSLDFDEQAIHLVNVTCSDLGDPPLSSHILLNVTLLPPDPTVLQFERAIYNISITENSFIGLEVIQLLAFSVTNDSSEVPRVIGYTLEPSDSPFTVDISTGLLAVNGSIDRESTPSYELTVTARLLNSDRAVPALAAVLVTVLDLNDNSPAFDDSEYSVTVMENTLAGSIITLTALDADLGINGTVQYSLLEPSGLFSIDNVTGSLNTTEPLDYEEMQLIVVSVVASDMGTPSLSSLANVTVIILDVNDNPPNLILIPDTTITVNESVEIGTILATLNVTDMDSQEVNGDLLLSLVSGDNGRMQLPEFRIDPVSGEILVSASLDYEMVQEYNLIITASDSSFPQLSSSQNLTVLVTDVNDNPPIFDQDVYNISLNEDVEVPSIIGILSATDDDSDNNADVEFAIVSLTNDTNSFRLNSNGSLEIVQPLNFEAQQEYDFTVMVRNSIPGSEADLAEVHIEVVDINEFSPSFSQDVYTASVIEEVSGAQVLQVIVSDEDSSDTVVLSIDDDSDFRIKSDGFIFTNTALDREAVDRYNFTVFAMDDGLPDAIISTAQIVVIVADVNDNVPVFDPTPDISILESTPIGTVIYTLSASDRDNGANGTIGAFSLTSDFFSLSENGELSVSANLNANSTPLYILTVIVQDLGTPPLSAATNLTINIESSPVPIFEQPSYSIVVLEGNTSNLFLLQVGAFSRNPEAVILGYFLESTSLSQLFNVDPMFGNVTVLGDLDREIRNTYSIEISVQAEFNSTTFTALTEVNITVLDVNDNPPHFVSSLQSISINETISTGTIITQFQASDADIGNNSIIEYSISAGNGDLLFEIDQNGVIMTTIPLLGRMGQHNLTIQASNPTEFNPLANSTQLMVEILPVNNFAPVFDSDLYSVNVSEDARVGTVIATVTATDSDVGSAGNIFYTIGNGASILSVDPSTGNISLEQSLDFESVTNYTATVLATDNGSPPRSSQVTLLVEVTDVNDSPPVFSQSLYLGSLDEELAEVQSILTLVTEDNDTSPNSQVNFEIYPSDLSTFFRITTGGVLENTMPIDRELHSTANLTVAASNLGSDGIELTATAMVLVTINDVNDNPPVFSREMYSVVLQAPLAVNTTITQVQASDADISEENSQVRFDLQEPNEVFYIDAESGLILTIAEITSEGNFSFTVTASDTVFSNQSQIIVFILSPDDLTAGRERDFVFSTDDGISLLGTPTEDNIDVYQQMYGFAVGRDIRQSRTITTSLNSLSTTLAVTPSLLVAETVRAVLVSSEVWHDRPIVQLTVQARDRTHNVHVTSFVEARVTHSVAGIVMGGCTTRSSDGTCDIAVDIPKSWFQNGGNATVDFGLSSSSLQSLGSVLLRPRSVFDAETDVYVYMEMPFRTLFSGDMFFVPVYGRTGTKGVGSYTVTVQGSRDINLINLIVNSTTWSPLLTEPRSNNITITAGRASQSIVPPAEEILLFTIQAQVSSSSGLDTLIHSALVSTIVELNDFDRFRLLPLPGMNPGPSFALSRNGVTSSGAVYVASDVTVGLLPYVSQSELVNTALLDRVDILEPIIILSIRRSGSVVTSSSSATCSSDNSIVIDVASNCDAITLTPNQVTGSVTTSISVTDGGSISSSLPIQVWVPETPLILSISDDILNSIPGVPDITNCSSTVKQFGFVSVFSRFTNSEEIIEDVDVTDFVSMSLTSSDGGVVTTSGNIVTGVRTGFATVRGTSEIESISFTEVAVTVVNSPVEILGLDVRVITALTASGPTSVTRLDANSLLVQSEQVFDFEGTQGIAVATAVFSDGSRILLDESRVSFFSLEPDIIQVVGASVTALASGSGEIVQAVWNSPSECTNTSGAILATGLATVTVNIPRPTSISATISTSSLSAPGSIASSIGVPTQTVLQVVAVYSSDGRTQDLTVDNRTIYNTPNNIELMRVGSRVIINTNSNATENGEFSISISFSQFQGMLVTVNFSIVSVSDIILVANPFPVYPGSSSRSVVRLSPIATSPERQQALLIAHAILTSGSRRDVSLNSDIEFFLSASPQGLQDISTITRGPTGNILSFDGPTSGNLSIRATLREEVSSSDALELDISSTPIQIQDISISPFPDGNTFRGLIGSTHQVVITVTLSDTTEYVNLFEDRIISNLVSFNATSSLSLTVNESSGLATLRGNSLTSATITVTSLGSDVSRSLDIACNLDPDIGDVDLGAQTGIPFPSLSTESEPISVDVRVNSGDLILDSFHLDIIFDPNIIRAVSADRGRDLPSAGRFQVSIDSPINIVTVAGTLVGSSPVSGLSHLATIVFRAVDSGVVNISGEVITLAQQTSGSFATNIGTVPRDFIAGAIQTMVTGSSRRRRDVNDYVVPHSRRYRRETEVCPSPPCASCSPQRRETGDLDGNCRFDIRDVSFLQLYYLNTSDTGIAPSLPSDREVFLDSDLNGQVDANDVTFMLRVSVGLLRFASRPVFTAVEESGESCQFGINIMLVGEGDIPSDNSSTTLIFDIAHQSQSFQEMFDATNFTLGRRLPSSKGPGLYGGLVEASYIGEGVYGISAESALGPTSFGISPIQVTFDEVGTTYNARVAAMFSQGEAPPLYSMLDASFVLREQAISVSTQLGYSPLVLESTSMTTQECLLLFSPLTFQNTPYVPSVSEGSAIDDVVLDVLVTSNRPSLSITYNISSLTELPFSINSETGRITVSSSLDFELTPVYNFEVFATELTVSNGAFTSSVQVSVQVTNENDNPPELTEIPDTFILANLQVGEQVYRVEATDLDNLAPLEYSLLLPSASVPLVIDSRTGVILTTGSLQPSLIVFTVVVSDGFFDNSTNGTLNVYFPSFSEQSYSATLSESSPIGAIVIQLQLVNVSDSQEFIFYSLNDNFFVDDMGEVTVNNILDYEMQVNHTVLVVSNSSDVQIQTTLLVFITDENDNPPIFAESRYNTSISSDTRVGSSVTQVMATDLDSPNSNNSAISYSIAPSRYFVVSQNTGDVTLSRTLFGGPSIVILNVTATDQGDPSLSGSVTLIIEIEPSSLATFPLPPTIGTSEGVWAQSSAVRIMEANNTTGALFQQNFTKVSSLDSGELSVSFVGSSLQSSIRIDTPLQEAASSTMHILHPTNIVYQESPDISLSFQVRDIDHLTRVAEGTDLEAQVTLNGTNQSITSSPCNLNPLTGVCVTRVSLPEDWFTSGLSPTITLESTLNGRPITSSTASFTLQPSPVISDVLNNNVLVELPSRDIISGESFTIRVYGYSAFVVSGYSVVIQTPDSLTVMSVVVDMTRWSTITTNSTGSFGITAVLSSPEEGAEGISNGRMHLYSLQVLSRADSSSDITVNISGWVQSLSNVVEGSIVLTSSGMTSGPAQVLSRDGLELEGAIYIVPNSVIALYPYIQTPELLNTAVLTNSTVSIPVQIFVGYTSGVLLESGSGGLRTLSCMSSEPSVINPDSSCTSVVLTGSEVSGSDAVDIMYFIGLVSAILPLQVYYPQTLTFISSDTTLNQIQYSSANGCTTYQQASLSVFTDFIASPGKAAITSVSVTDLISPRLSSTDEAILTVDGNRVNGLGPGQAMVCAGDDCISITVSSDPVTLSGLVGSVLIDIAVASNTNLDTNNVASIRARSEFQFEQEQGSLLVAVQYSDGVVSSVRATEVSILPSSNTSVYVVGDDNTILAQQSGEAIGSFTWQPLNNTCNVEIIDYFLVSASLPDPIGIETSISSSRVLTTFTDPSALLGNPTSITFSILLIFPGGNALDVTSDSRVSVQPASDIIEVNEGVISATGSGSGAAQLDIQYASNGITFTTNVSLQVVLSISVSVLAHPYPIYPGSASVNISRLRPIEMTGKWQRAILELYLLLSNGTSVVVTDLTEVTISIMDLSNINPEISNNILSVDGVGTLFVRGVISGTTLRDELMLFATTDSVTVNSTRINPFPSDTLRGISGQITQQSVSVDLSFSDGTQLLFYPTHPSFSSNLLPGIITAYTSTSEDTFSVDDNGLLRPLANFHELVSVRVTAGSNSITSSYSFIVNLDPDIGDIDIGMEFGPPIPDTRGGDIIFVPVRLNTGGRNLGSIDIVLTYDESALSPVEVTRGPEFQAGLHESVLNDPPGEVRFGGALSVDVSGSMLHIFNVAFNVTSSSLSSGESFFRGTVITVAERTSEGTPIGSSTPRAIVAGNVTFNIAGISKRSIRKDYSTSSKSSPVRYRRQVECPTPPSCTCAGVLSGDTDGNCVFDIRDVSFTLMYISQSLISPSLSNQITPAQMNQLDPNQDDTIDTSDVFFLLRALFGLIYFLESVSVIPVQDISSACLFSVQVQLTIPQDNSTLGKVDIFLDFGFLDAISDVDFSNSVFVTGELQAADKGSSLNGGFVLTEQLSNGVFAVQMNSSLVSNDIGVSIVMVTYDSRDSTSSSRSVQFFGHPPILYPSPLSTSLTGRNGADILVAATSGYSPFIVTSNTIASSDCSDIPVLDLELNFTILSPFMTELSWQLLNFRQGLDFTSDLQLYVTSCEINQDGVSVNSTCNEPNVEDVDNTTSHKLTTSPFTWYYIVLQAPTSSTNSIQIMSPEAPPTGIASPSYQYKLNDVIFMWSLPTLPNGIITHYTLYIDSRLLYNGSVLSFTHTQLTPRALNFSLEAHNSAGTGSSDIALASPSPSGVSLAVEEAIIICVAASAFIISVLLAIMLCGMARRRRVVKEKKRPAFLSHNFESEITGVVST